MDDADIISRLPDDLLISILSRLTLEEAIVTSVLSRRWEKLWTYYHGNLDFKVSNAVKEKGCSNYARVVSKVLDTLERVEDGGVIDSLTIRFDLCPNNMSSVDRWVHFALEKRRVKRLDFNPISWFNGVCIHDYNKTYDFPPLEYFYAQQCNIQALTSITFWRVNVSGGVIEHLLSNCPLLQSLELSQLCPLLTHLRVSGEACALRHLCIMRCPYLTTIEISVPNLVSLHYERSKIENVKFDVLSVPKLVEMSIEVVQAPLTASGLHFFSCFSCLQKLNLQICSKEPDDSFKSIEITSVKHLTMNFAGDKWAHVFAWTPVLKAFPLLHKFTLDMCLRMKGRRMDVARDDDKFPNKCLEVFEFLGFGNSDDDIELVMYLLKNVVPLEKIILLCDAGLDHFRRFYGDVPAMKPWDIKCLERAVSLAEKLRQIIPKRVNLVLT